MLRRVLFPKTANDFQRGGTRTGENEAATLRPRAPQTHGDASSVLALSLTMCGEFVPSVHDDYDDLKKVLSATRVLLVGLRGRGEHSERR